MKIPYILRWDKMPINISAAFGDEKPAGKHGFLRAKGDKFFFEDGTPAAFDTENTIDAATVEFSDWALVADYAKEAITKMTGLGIVKGNDDGTLNPLGNTTRAEAAVIMQRIHNWNKA